MPQPIRNEYSPWRQDYRPQTLTAQADGWRSPVTGAVPPPVSMGATYARDEDYGLPGGMAYLRDQALHGIGQPQWTASTGTAEALHHGLDTKHAEACPGGAAAPSERTCDGRVNKPGLTEDPLEHCCSPFVSAVNPIDCQRTVIGRSASAPSSCSRCSTKAPCAPQFALWPVQADSGKGGRPIGTPSASRPENVTQGVQAVLRHHPGRCHASRPTFVQDPARWSPILGGRPRR